MSGETEREVSGWTVDTLKAHLEAVMEEHEKLINARLDAAAVAVTKAEEASERRFESVNEFRAQLGEQATEFLRRDNFESVLVSWQQWRNSVEERLNTAAGASAAYDKSRSFVFALIGAGVAVISIVVVLANVLTNR